MHTHYKMNSCKLAIIVPAVAKSKIQDRHVALVIV